MSQTYEATRLVLWLDRPWFRMALKRSKAGHPKLEWDEERRLFSSMFRIRADAETLTDMMYSERI